MTAHLQVAAGREAVGPFVINLCASTTPMALAQPDAPELKRFNFFVSRRREDGRERFRLHMGYFLTLAEAEEWINVVRDIYPGAWAGEAPGKNLAQRVAAVAAPRVSGADSPAPAPVAAVPQPLAVAPAPVIPMVVPTVHATADAAPGNGSAVRAAVVAEPPAKKAPAPKPAVPAATPVKVATRAPEPAAKPAPAKATAPASNVREVLKSLDDSGHTRIMPAAAPAKTTRSTARATAIPVKASPAAPAREPAALSDTAVLRILENRRADSSAPAGESASSGIAMLRPDDTATCHALKDAVQENAPVSFAVQLQWSVQQVELTKVPPLVIFSAYTLYTVEGSRDGRKWYGLRLGFFGDAISAKQVAMYVRSEFTSVAVIPVSAQERGRATQNDPAVAAKAARPRKDTPAGSDEFKLIDDRTDEVAAAAFAAAQAQLQSKAAKPAATAKSASAGKPAARRKALGRVRAGEKRSTMSLEETLEILGASGLEIDNGRGELLNDSGVRHLRVEAVQKNSPFSRLLVRLSERVRKSG